MMNFPQWASLRKLMNVPLSHPHRAMQILKIVHKGKRVKFLFYPFINQ